MSVELIRCKQITYCKFCKSEEKKVKCVWKTKHSPPFGFRDYYRHYSCDEHKNLIEDPDPNGFHKIPKVEKVKTNRDDHLTEADYETWMKL